MKLDEIVVEGVKYVPEGSAKASAPSPTGKRCIIVADRGWVFAGDITDVDGRIKLTRACIIQRWEGIGFDGLCEFPVSSKVTVKPCADIDLPRDSELFRVPVNDAWGL